MPLIRLLTSVAGGGPVTGDAGDVLDVDERTARTWADGVRAERIDRRVQVDSAVVEAPENAAARAARQRPPRG